VFIPITLCSLNTGSNLSVISVSSSLAVICNIKHSAQLETLLKGILIPGHNFCDDNPTTTEKHLYLTAKLHRKICLPHLLFLSDTGSLKV